MKRIFTSILLIALFATCFTLVACNEQTATPEYFGTYKAIGSFNDTLKIDNTGFKIGDDYYTYEVNDDYFYLKDVKNANLRRFYKYENGNVLSPNLFMNFTTGQITRRDGNINASLISYSGTSVDLSWTFGLDGTYRVLAPSYLSLNESGTYILKNGLLTMVGTYALSGKKSYSQYYIDSSFRIHTVAFVKNMSIFERGQTPSQPGEQIPSQPSDTPSEHIHNYFAQTTYPTCTKQGFTKYTCTCGDQYIGDYTEPLGHNYDSVVTEPTCTEKGYTTHTCTRCDESYIDDYIEPLGHDYDIDHVCTRCGIDSLSVDGYEFNLLEDGSYAITGYSGASTELNIPSTYLRQKITSIARNAFNSQKLLSISMPSTITTIDDRAFQNCTELTSITIPNNVTTIGDYAFDGCTKLESITIGNSVINLGPHSFSNCNMLKSVAIPNSVTNIDEYAFDGCNSIESVSIGDGVLSIGKFAFANCHNLSSITVPTNVVQIGGFAFSGCSSLESITIPFVGTQADKTGSDDNQNPFGAIFGGDSYDGGTAVSQDYYRIRSYGCSTTTYYIPSTLRDVTVTGGNILYGAFSNCSMLTSITLPDSLTDIGGYAFAGCTGLTSFSIPNSVTSIGGEAFSGCTGLTSVTIPDNVTSIGSGAFYGCTGLTSITLPTNLNNIGIRAFEGCTSLTTIDIPNGVTTINSRAFMYCTNLSSAIIGNGTTLIDSYAFCNCTSLSTISLPNSVTSIGVYALDDCKSLTSITFGGTKAQWYAIKKSGIGYNIGSYTVHCTDGDI